MILDHLTSFKGHVELADLDREKDPPPPLSLSCRGGDVSQALAPPSHSLNKSHRGTKAKVSEVVMLVWRGLTPSEDLTGALLLALSLALQKRIRQKKREREREPTI